MPDERYSDEPPRDRPDERYSDEPSEGRRYEDDERRRYDDRDIRQNVDIPNYLVKSILVTFCCWPSGIVAIVNAAKVGSLIQAGDYQAAKAASDQAKKWCIIGFIGGLIAPVFLVALEIMAAGGRP